MGATQAIQSQNVAGAGLALHRSSPSRRSSAARLM